jgi:hypothetical protein
MSAKAAQPAPSATPQASDPIVFATQAARTALADLASGLLERSATAQHGVASALDAISSLERSLALVRFEAIRQADVAKRRADRAAVDAALK